MPLCDSDWILTLPEQLNGFPAQLLTKRFIIKRLKLRGGTTMDSLSMSTLGLVSAIIAIVFGIIILVWPRVLAYLIGVYLIIIGAFFFIQRFF